jgi:hypothetical protein
MLSGNCSEWRVSGGQCEVWVRLMLEPGRTCGDQKGGRVEELEIGAQSTRVEPYYDQTGRT